MPKGMDAVKAMDSCKELLITFGGHAPAAGLLWIIVILINLRNASRIILKNSVLFKIQKKCYTITHYEKNKL